MGYHHDFINVDAERCLAQDTTQLQFNFFLFNKSRPTEQAIRMMSGQRWKSNNLIWFELGWCPSQLLYSSHSTCLTFNHVKRWRESERNRLWDLRRWISTQRWAPTLWWRTGCTCNRTLLKSENRWGYSCRKPRCPNGYTEVVKRREIGLTVQYVHGVIGLCQLFCWVNRTSIATLVLMQATLARRSLYLTEVSNNTVFNSLVILGNVPNQLLLLVRMENIYYLVGMPELHYLLVVRHLRSLDLLCPSWLLTSRPRPFHSQPQTRSF